MKHEARTLRLAALALITMLATVSAPALIGAREGSGDASAVRVRGIVTVYHADDFAGGRFEDFHVLEEIDAAGRPTGRSFELRFEGEPPASWRSGWTVRLRGEARGSELTLPSGGDGGVESVEAATVAVAGEQSTIVLAINFLDRALACSPSEIEGRMFSGAESIDRLYREVSFGLLGFSGLVAGPFTIDYQSSSACDYRRWADAADQAAQAAGIDLRPFRRRLYVLPPSSCNFAGVATIGGSPSRAWVFQCRYSDIYAHELGHNLGMHHASTASSEYGDTSDIMGISGMSLRHVNAAHKVEMGWVPPEHVLTLGEGGVYEVALLEQDPAASGLGVRTQCIKIPKPDTGEHYYLSYRVPVGFDSKLASTYRYATSIHTWRGPGRRTFFLKALPNGAGFEDLANGISIRQLDSGPYHATIAVALECQPMPPRLAAAPSIQAVRPGGSLQIELLLASLDGALCPPASFTLAASAPGGWQAFVAPQSLLIAPGQTGSSRLDVTCPAAALDGTYTLQVEAWGDGSSRSAASAAPRVVVDSVPPSTPADLRAAADFRRVDLSWSAGADNYVLAGYIVLRDGVALAAVGTTSYSDTSAAAGATYAYQVLSVDAAGNQSPPTTPLQVTVPATRGKGKPKK
jgi:hypothetical protein